MTRGNANDRDDGVWLSRRRLLGATGALAGAGYLASAGGRAQTASTIELGGEIAGWRGRSPEEIADETNPTLRLEAGQEYRITWTNLDGFGHNLALLDDDGGVLERTSVMSEEGESQSLTFTASEAMAEYVCEPHEGSMRGAISFGNETVTETTTESDSEPVVPEGPTVALDRIAGGFEVPTDFAAPPGDGRRFVLDLPGQVYVHTDDGLREEPFLDVGDRLAELTAERGLLGIAFHPEFADNGRFYLRYSAPLADDAPAEFSHTEVLAEFTVDEDGEHADPDSERVLLAIDEPTPYHNGGAITFGPDGYLYASYGDGGSPKDMGPGHAEDWYEANGGGNGQDVTENLLGSVLRIDVDGESDGKPYGIPEDNPLVGEEGLDEHYAWGFRNPWRMGFSNGELYVADVGQSRYEEVNRVVKGGNYGWNVREGTHCFGTENVSDVPDECPDSTPPDVRGGEPLRDPVVEYPHQRDGEFIGISVVGGYIYGNDAIPGLEGKYVFGDYSQKGNPRGSLFAATPTEDGQWDFSKLRIAGAESGAVEGYLIAIGRDETGDLYALTSAGDLGGAVHRITAAEGEAASDTAAGTQNATAATEATGTASTSSTAGPTTGSGTTGAVTDRRTSAATDTSRAATGAETSAGAPATSARTGGSGASANGDTNGSGGNASSETTATDGPGFGVLAALAGVAGLAARRLGRDR
ncbi:PQQ-dependent sugar dehydrogenase [Halococcus salsus]|uniref:PQQ-dependent sugar dehydrogenase n=1 Tax=Halococcus salsus TaxID=2162894 RepID=UPI001359B1A5|nr:PQQ-dependent sugar dehydrogenase [Halococcus salsus]